MFEMDNALVKFSSSSVLECTSSTSSRIVHRYSSCSLLKVLTLLFAMGILRMVPSGSFKWYIAFLLTLCITYGQNQHLPSFHIVVCWSRSCHILILNHHVPSSWMKLTLVIFVLKSSFLQMLNVFNATSSSLHMRDSHFQEILSTHVIMAWHFSS